MKLILVLIHLLFKGGKDAKKGGGGGKDAVPKTPDIAEAPKDLVFSGAQAVCAASSANCVAAARVRSLEPYQYISELSSGEVKSFKTAIN